MPERPLRPCTYPGCSTLTQSGRCPKHQAQDKAAESKRRADQDAQRKTDGWMSYDYQWDKFRKLWLRAHPLCGQRLAALSTEHSRCWMEGRSTPGTEVDHIIPHKGDSKLFWSKDNLQTLCKSCHSTKTMNEVNAQRNAMR